MVKARGITLLALSALAGAPAAAEQATPTARLVYQRAAGAESCPDVDALQQLVSTRLGYSPWTDDDERLVEVALTRDRGQLVARIELRDPQSGRSGERRLSSRAAGCEELAAAMVLAICIAIDPLRMALAAASLPAPEPVSEPATLPETAPASLPESVPVLVETPASAPASEPVAQPLSEEPPDRIRLYAGLGTHLTLGTSPTVAFGPKLMAGIGYSFFSLEFEARSEFCTSFSLANLGAFGATGLGSVALVPCINLWWFQVCGVAAIGQLSGVVFTPVPGVESRLSLTGGARIGLEFPIYPWLALRLQGDAMINIVPIDLSPLWQSPFGAVALGTTALVIYFD